MLAALRLGDGGPSAVVVAYTRHALAAGLLPPLRTATQLCADLEREVQSHADLESEAGATKQHGASTAAGAAAGAAAKTPPPSSARLTALASLLGTVAPAAMRASWDAPAPPPGATAASSASCEPAEPVEPAVGVALAARLLCVGLAALSLPHSATQHEREASAVEGEARDAACRAGAALLAAVVPCFGTLHALCVAHATRQTDKSGAWRAVAEALQRARARHAPVPRLLAALAALAARGAAAAEEASSLPMLLVRESLCAASRHEGLSAHGLATAAASLRSGGVWRAVMAQAAAASAGGDGSVAAHVDAAGAPFGGGAAAAEMVEMSEMRSLFRLALCRGVPPEDYLATARRLRARGGSEAVATAVWREMLGSPGGGGGGGGGGGSGSGSGSGRGADRAVELGVATLVGLDRCMGMPALLFASTEHVLPVLLPRLLRGAPAARAAPAALALHALWREGGAGTADGTADGAGLVAARARLGALAMALLREGGAAARAALLLLMLLAVEPEAQQQLWHTWLPAHARASLAATLLAVGHAPLALELFELGNPVEAACCARAEEEAQPGACAAPVVALELLRALEQQG